MIKIKKKLIECPRHGLTLHRCKRVCWKTRSSKKDKGYASEYTEKCFKCILKGRYKKREVEPEKRNKHISI